MNFLRESSQVLRGQIPSVENIAWHPVEPRLKFQIFVTNLVHLLWFIPVSVSASAVWLYMDSIEPEAGYLGWTSLIQSFIAVGLATLVPLFLFLWYIAPFFEVPKRMYAVRREDLNYQRGLFTTTESSAPIKRIQHASTCQNLFEKMFNLSSLEIHTAAGQAIRVAGLNPEAARDLQDHILKKISLSLPVEGTEEYKASRGSEHEEESD